MPQDQEAHRMRGETAFRQGNFVRCCVCRKVFFRDTHWEAIGISLALFFLPDFECTSLSFAIHLFEQQTEVSAYLLCAGIIWPEQVLVK